MPDYSKGKIYKIVVDTDEEYKPYVGSTCQELSQRMTDHRSKYKNWKNGGGYMKSFKLFDEFGVDKCKIILLEEYSCENNNQLRAKEREWFDKIECCNKIRPHRTDEEIVVQRKKCGFEYYQKNCEKIKIKVAEYREKNKEKINIHMKEYTQINKEKISEKRKNKITCECGDIICLSSLYNHRKTQKHILGISQK